MSILGDLMRRLGVAPAAPPLLTIPLADETAEQFFSRANACLVDARTHVYVDTSMLMWLTKIGEVARSQLIDWLEANCRGRLHVPLWAAHEFFRHHVERTAVANLGEAIGHLRKAAGVYSTIHPYLDEQLGVDSARRQQSDARQALTRAADLADLLGKWSALYAVHAQSVLDFINRHGTSGTNVFETVGDIQAVGAARFAGRLPPGFKDRGKKEPVETSKRGKVEGGSGWTGGGDSVEPSFDEAPATVGHNKWGDLLFWKETLAHARERRARAVVILTNDRKNDWYMGGGSMAGATLEMQRVDRLKPIPRPHPVLVAEARSAASVSQLILLDAPYAALLLKRVAPSASDAFADVALVQRLAPTPTGGGMDGVEDGTAQPPPPPKVAPQWRDPPNLSYTRSKLRDALTQSRAQPAGPAAALVDLAERTLAGGEGIAGMLTAERLGGADAQTLVTFAREVGDRARQGVANWPSAASDLSSALPTIPHKTAGCLYFGLLASAYLGRTDNAVRLPPDGPFLNLLWDLAGLAHFIPAISALRDRIAKGDRWPMYCVGDDAPPSVLLEVDPDCDDPTSLRQLRVGAQLLLQPAQFRAELRLRERADGAERITGERIVRIACEVFGIPFDAIQPIPDFAREFAIKREIGFRDPAATYTIRPEAE